MGVLSALLCWIFANEAAWRILKTWAHSFGSVPDFIADTHIFLYTEDMNCASYHCIIFSLNFYYYFDK